MDLTTAIRKTKKRKGAKSHANSATNFPQSVSPISSPTLLKNSGIEDLVVDVYCILSPQVLKDLVVLVCLSNSEFGCQRCSTG